MENIFNKYSKLTLIIINIFLLFLLFSFDLLWTKIAKYKEYQRDFDLIRISHPVYHHTFLPNSKNIDSEYTLYTNSLGFKDSSSKKISLVEKKYRILFMGDSFTEGIRLNYEDTFVGLIEKELNKKNIEVLNGGRGSYSPIIYWRKIKYLIEEIGLDFDEVVLFIDISDPYDEITSYELSIDENVISKNNLLKLSSIKKKSPEQLSLFKIEKIKKFIFQNMRLTHFILNFVYDKIGFNIENGGNWKTSIMHSKVSSWTLEKKYYDSFGNEGIILMKKYINKLNKLLIKNNIKLTIAVYPWPYQIWNEDLNSIHVKIWQEWSFQNNVKFINYFPNFVDKKLDKNKKLELLERNYFSGNNHFNKSGNIIIAEKYLNETQKK